MSFSLPQMHFLVKKPSWLTFDPSEYSDEEVRSLQVRHRHHRSNTLLVRFKDGSWYLKNGSQLFKLKNVEMKNNISLGKKDGNKIHVDASIDRKWFIGSENLTSMP
jgi:hypothetical protein